MSTEATGKVGGIWAKFQATVSTDAPPVPTARARCSSWTFILCRAAKNEPRKRAKGSNTPWYPRARKRRCVSLRSYLRGVEHLQLLRWLFKEKRQHGRRTHAKQQKLLPFLPHLLITNFSTKTILPSSPAARGGKAAGDTRTVFLCLSPQLALKSGNRRGFPGGTPGRLFFAYSLRQGKE